MHAPRVYLDSDIRPRPCFIVALRAEELERFDADAEFFKSVRYTLEEAMNVCIVPSYSRMHTQELTRDA